MPAPVKKGNSPRLVVIRVLIVLLFITALAVGLGRLVEFQRNRKKAAELAAEKQRLEEAISGEDQAQEDSTSP